MRELPMTPGEILTSYKQAANRKDQIRVLSELNACTTQEIREVLASQGIPWEEMGSRPWTEEEVQRLLRMADTKLLSRKEMAEELGRSTVEVKGKLQRMARKEQKMAEISKQELEQAKADIDMASVSPLEREQFLTMLYQKLDNEMQYGHDAKLQDMLSSLGFMILKHFLGAHTDV